MKPTIKSLRSGQKVWAIVEEAMAGGELLVNFTGDLLRVANDTSKAFRAGQRVLLQVISVRPLKFKLKLATVTPRSLDITI